jgi:hypothetical protein
MCRFSPECGLPSEHTFLDDHFWRISGRNGRFLTIEFAAFGCDSETGGALSQMLATAGPGDAEDSLDAEYWKANSQLYLVEDVPFGVVTVQAPRNVSNPEAYALGRAKSLLGLEEPSDIQILDYALAPDTSEIIHGDLYVHLHYHGFYQD